MGADINKKDLSKKDVLKWDIVNWSKAIRFWEKNNDLTNKKYTCIELGCGDNGGLSLWLSGKGHRVLCTDYYQPELAKEKHKKLGFLDIRYEKISAIDIPYREEFDFVVFKSVIGGIQPNLVYEHEIISKVFKEIYKILKPGGYILFAENMKGSPFHLYMRRKYAPWSNNWHYFDYQELTLFLHDFSNIKIRTVGFLGLFGWNEKVRSIFGRVDSLIEPFIPKRFRYIFIASAQKI